MAHSTAAEFVPTWQIADGQIADRGGRAVARIGK